MVLKVQQSEAYLSSPPLGSTAPLPFYSCARLPPGLCMSYSLFLKFPAPSLSHVLLATQLLLVL